MCMILASIKFITNLSSYAVVRGFKTIQNFTNELGRYNPFLPSSAVQVSHEHVTFTFKTWPCWSLSEMAFLFIYF